MYLHTCELSDHEDRKQGPSALYCTMYIHTSTPFGYLMTMELVSGGVFVVLSITCTAKVFG